MTTEGGGTLGSRGGIPEDDRGFAGRRILVTGGGGAVADAVARRLVAAGAEVHTAGLRRPAVGGIASYTAADWRTPDSAEHVLARVGSVVEAVLHAADAPPGAPRLERLLAGPVALRALAGAAPARMPLGGPIVVPTAPDRVDDDARELAALDAESLRARGGADLAGGDPARDDEAVLAVSAVVAACLADELAAAGVTLLAVAVEAGAVPDDQARLLVTAARFAPRR